MPELAEVETPKTAGYIDRGYNYNKKRKRMEDEEEEIKKLEAQQRGELEDEEQSEEITKTEEADTEVEEATLSPEEKSFKKRYGDLRRHMQEKEKEWNEKFEAFEKRMKKESIVPPKSDEDIEQWAKEYPDVAGIVETIAAKKAQEMFAKAEIRLQELDDAQAEVTRSKAENKIKETHADFDELRESDKFHDWADEQPKWVRDALYENSDDPASVVRIIDLYKIDNGLTSNDRKTKRKAAASTVTKRSKTEVDVEDANNVITETQVAKMSAKEFEERSDEINIAIRSGKFVYDMSGNAR
jgi:hypothetical protein